MDIDDTVCAVLFALSCVKSDFVIVFWVFFAVALLVNISDRVIDKYFMKE